MRLLKRNMTKFKYYPYAGTETDVNSDGEHTGDYSQREFGTPVVYAGNISVPSGQTSQQFYGEDIRYTHTLLMDNPKAEIDEYGVIEWLGAKYDIVAVRPSLNVLNIALRKQTEDWSE